MKDETKLPNNILPYKSKISLSETEFDEIKAGKPFPSWKFIPWILDELGHELMKRPPSAEEPKEEEPVDLSPEETAAKAKAAKAAAAAQLKAETEAAAATQARLARNAARAERRTAGEEPVSDDEPEPEIIEDLSITDLVLHQETYPEGHQVDTGETREVEDPPESGEMKTEAIMKDVGGQIKEDAAKPNPCGFILLGFPSSEVHA